MSILPNLPLYWLGFISGIIFLALWIAYVKGRLFSFMCLLMALPGILFDVVHHVWMSVIERLPCRKRKAIELDEYERKLS